MKTWKKLLALLMALAIMFTLAACEIDIGVNNDDNDRKSSSKDKDDDDKRKDDNDEDEDDEDEDEEEDEDKVDNEQGNNDIENPDFTVEEIINAAYSLQPGETLDGEYGLQGTISQVNTPWNASYGNITVTITVDGFENKPIVCYRMVGDGADSLKVGDVIFVSGSITNYNGTIEFSAGCLLEEIVTDSGLGTPINPSNPVTGTFTKISQLQDGDKIIIVNPASNMAFSMTKSGYYNIGIDISGGFGAITTEEVVIAKKNHDGTWCFTTEDGRNLSMGEEFSSMDETGANTTWVLETTGNGNFYLMNEGRVRYLEWSTTYNNWTSYFPEEFNADYLLNFYKLS